MNNLIEEYNSYDELEPYEFLFEMASILPTVSGMKHPIYISNKPLNKKPYARIKIKYHDNLYISLVFNPEGNILEYLSKDIDKFKRKDKICYYTFVKKNVEMLYKLWYGVYNETELAYNAKKYFTFPSKC